MLATECHDKYQRAQARRTNHPLRQGKYKLKETRVQLCRARNTLAEIERVTRLRMKFYANAGLECCTSRDRGDWMKSVPLIISDYLGYNVVPSVHALHGDGVSPSRVQQLAQEFTTEALVLVDRCEQVRRNLKPSIKREYAAMRAGNSELLPLVDAAVDIIDQALWFVPPRIAA